MSRTLTVASSSGLANRLRVLCSGVALAEATDRSFCMLWPNDRHTCGIGFHELFDSELNVEDLPNQVLLERFDDEAWLVGDGHFRRLPDLTSSDDQHLRCSAVDWLIDPSAPSGRVLLARAHEVLGQLQLRTDLAREVDRLLDGVARPIVGVHLRRGDFVGARSGVVGNLDASIAVVSEQIDKGAATVLLVTDDGAPADLRRVGARPEIEGVRPAFRDAFAGRLIETSPRSLDRASAIAVEDAVIDLWALRQADIVVGTASSSFSELGAAGRDVRYVETSGRVVPRRFVDRWLERLGLARAVEALGRRIYGRDIPLSALTYRATGPLRRAGRPVKRAMRRRTRDGGR